jgi:hypothetical protein
MRAHTSLCRCAYVSIRQRTSAYVSIRPHTSISSCHYMRTHTSLCRCAYVSIRQHTSAYVRIPLYYHASTCVLTPLYIDLSSYLYYEAQGETRSHFFYVFVCISIELLNESSYLYMCVFLPLYMCPHTSIAPLYMCPDTSICVSFCLICVS